MSDRVLMRVGQLCDEYRLPEAAPQQFNILLKELESEPSSISSIRVPIEAVDRHIADSLTGLRVPGVPTAKTACDLGSGGGFPGLVLAVALPDCSVSLVESVGRKCRFLERVARTANLANVSIVNSRAETWPDGIGRHDLVTVRALAPLNILVEYAAPLLAIGGILVSWKGRRDAAEAEAGAAAGALVGLSLREVIELPRAAAAERHLYVYSKVRGTPARYPRRVGMARKRPLGT